MEGVFAVCTDSGTFCSVCNREAELNEDFDAWFCVDCGWWLEGICGTPNCYICYGRPDKPICVVGRKNCFEVKNAD